MSAQCKFRQINTDKIESSCDIIVKNLQHLQHITSAPSTFTTEVTITIGLHHKRIFGKRKVKSDLCCQTFLCQIIQRQEQLSIFQKSN